MKIYMVEFSNGYQTEIIAFDLSEANHIALEEANEMRDAFVEVSFITFMRDYK
jgi:hypothetical protein